jgi:putative glutamine amidotransferase
VTAPRGEVCVRSIVIGVTAWFHRARWSAMDGDAAIVEESLLAKLLETDTPVVVVPPYAAVAERVVDHLDGLLLTGGPDIDPLLYGQPPHPRTRADDPRRDAGEIALTRAALERGLPVLGICRGCQVLNVACGGTLIQHLPDVSAGVRHAANGQAALEGGVFLNHDVVADAGSRLEEICGRRFTVKSAHHQAVGALGRRLAPVAWSADGSIEAIVHVDLPFAMGVQWHPEAELGVDLFEELAAAARKRRSPTSGLPHAD